MTFTQKYSICEQFGNFRCLSLWAISLVKGCHVDI
ncbi:hypothetical protein V6Z12_A08G096500 [Gossypium hirsutum]